MDHTANNQAPISLAITGASGAIYGFKLLKFFIENKYKVDLVLSDSARKVAAAELGLQIENLGLHDTLIKILDFISANTEEHKKLLQIWDHTNVAASISSGSYKTQGMIIAPCSMGTLANIANGTSNNLISRAADVCLKERRKLILVARETPLNSIHLQNMLSLSQIGAIILPAAPGFYHQPQSIDDQVNFILGKTLDTIGIDNQLFKRWVGESRTAMSKEFSKNS